MEYIKRFFIVIGLFLLSQIGMFTYGTLKQSSLQVGQGTMPLLSTLILIVIFIMNIGLLFVLANKLELLNFDSKFLNKKNILIIVIGVVIARLVAILGTILLNNQDKKEQVQNHQKKTPFQVLFYFINSFPDLDFVLFLPLGYELVQIRSF
ncbi:hypothetical protein [Enterococcus faecalis]